MTRTRHHSLGDKFAIKKNRSKKHNHAVPRKWWVEGKLFNRLARAHFFFEEIKLES